MPTGTVTFFNGATVLGTATLINGVAALKTSALPVGTSTITAVYSGDGNSLTSTSSSLSQTVNQASAKIALTSSLNPAPTGSAVTFTAKLSAVSPGAGVPTGTVQFYDAATLLGTGTLGPTGLATFTISTLARGKHTITAVYSGDIDFLAVTSSALTETMS
jgi:hypothetical protein